MEVPGDIGEGWLATTTRYLLRQWGAEKISQKKRSSGSRREVRRVNDEE